MDDEVEGLNVGGVKEVEVLEDVKKRLGGVGGEMEVEGVGGEVDGIDWRGECGEEWRGGSDGG